MEEKAFNIPEFEYFEMSGKYSGNKRGAAQDDFNFLFTPKEKLLAQIWYGINCFETARKKSLGQIGGKTVSPAKNKKEK